MDDRRWAIGGDRWAMGDERWAMSDVRCEMGDGAIGDEEREMGDWMGGRWELR